MSCPECDLSKITLLVSARLGSNLHLADISGLKIYQHFSALQIWQTLFLPRDLCKCHSLCMKYLSLPAYIPLGSFLLILSGVSLKVTSSKWHFCNPPPLNQAYVSTVTFFLHSTFLHSTFRWVFIIFCLSSVGLLDC